MSTTITEFLLARIAEDEAVALPFKNELGDVRQWQADDIGGVVRTVDPRPLGLPDMVGTCSTHLEADLMSRYDPARVLAECAAKRAIVAYFELEAEKMADPRKRQAASEPEWWLMRAAERTLHSLAAVYSTHPDYRQEWAL